MNKRFQDSNLRLADFTHKVLVACPKCGEKAIVTPNEKQGAVLSCPQCNYINKNPLLEYSDNVILDFWFGQELWLHAPFKNEVFWANNYEHLDYIKKYIQSGLRERNGRAFFTLVEKLPQFIKSAKNRERLLKLIEKLEKK